MKLIELTESVSMRFDLTITSGRFKRERKLDERSLKSLNAAFMSNAQKLRAMKLAVNDEFSYTNHDDHVVKITVLRTK